MTDARETAATDHHVGGRHINGETTEMTDLVDFTDHPDTTATTAMLESVFDVSLAATSHSAQQGNSSRKRDIGSSQELSSAHSQEVTSGQDAQLTTLDIETKQAIEQPGTETGRAETTQNHHAAVGYKREHSHSPCSQMSSLPLADTTSSVSACRAAGCITESISEQELVVDGETLHSGGQGEDRQPRKRAKLEALEGEVAGGGSGLPSSTGTPETQPDTPPPLLLMEQDHALDPSPSLEVTAAALPQSPPPATTCTRGAPIIPTRPTFLLVSLSLDSVSPAVAIPNAPNEGGDDRFPSSEEERTPDGGRRELVGHPYRCALINNGETVVTPERPALPPNMVFGHQSPLSTYRRQLSDNNAYYHSLSRCELMQSEAQTERTVRRQNSAPPYAGIEARIDNNGRIIGEGHNVPISRTPTL